MSKANFKSWAAGEGINLDLLADATDPDEVAPGQFVFRHGHRARMVGEIERRGHGENATARLIHNELQAKLFEHLASIHGERNVGTEIPARMLGVVVDAAVKSEAGLSFYEIKTSTSIRKCIREAIPQLLEYAHWPAANRARELVIVSTNRPTKDAKKYLKLLRERFSLPIFHETIDRLSGQISERI